MIKKKQNSLKKEKNREIISEDRKKYLKSIKINKIKILVTQITLVIVLIVAWEVLARIR